MVTFSDTYHMHSLIYSISFFATFLAKKKNCCLDLQNDRCRLSECVAQGEDRKVSGIQLYQENCASFKVRRVEFAGVDYATCVAIWNKLKQISVLMLAIEWKSVTSVDCSVSV
jgi:hypothetical protein